MLREVRGVRSTGRHGGRVTLVRASCDPRRQVPQRKIEMSVRESGDPQAVLQEPWEGGTGLCFPMSAYVSPCCTQISGRLSVVVVSARLGAEESSGFLVVTLGERGWGGSASRPRDVTTRQATRGIADREASRCLMGWVLSVPLSGPLLAAPLRRVYPAGIPGQATGSGGEVAGARGWG